MSSNAAQLNAVGFRWRSDGRHALSLFGSAAIAVTLGCASYGGTARSVDPQQVAQHGNWLLVPKFPLVRQQRSDDCGAAALSAVMRYWGYDASPDSIEAILGRSDPRLRAGDMVAYARRKGLRSFVFYGSMTDIVHEIRQGRPVIVGLGKTVNRREALSHYEVVVGYEPDQQRILLLDPASGWQLDTLAGFGEESARTKGVTIVAFLPESTGSLF